MGEEEEAAEGRRRQHENVVPPPQTQKEQTRGEEDKRQRKHVRQEVGVDSNGDLDAGRGEEGGPDGDIIVTGHDPRQEKGGKNQDRGQ